MEAIDLWRATGYILTVVATIGLIWQIGHALLGIFSDHENKGR